MSRLALAAIAVTVALTGCTRRQADFAWFATAVALEVAQAAATATPENSGTGVAVAAPANYETMPGPSQAELQRSHDVALELTWIAVHDARTNNCPAVVRTSDRVRVLDGDVFVTVFLKDPEIQRCLAFGP